MNKLNLLGKNGFALFLSLLPLFLTAQVSESMTLEAIWDDPANTFYNDIWGYTADGGNEYAVIGSRAKVHFIDISDPTSPVLKNEFTPGYSSTWRDFKNYDRFVYGISDSGGGTLEGLIIWDMSCLLYTSPSPRDS